MNKTRKVVSFFLIFVLMCSFMLPAFSAAAVDDKKATFNGHTYQRFDKSMSWKDAKAYCETLGGYLATITSSDEYEVVKSLIAKGSKAQYWLGATDEVTLNDWQWVTGETFTFWADTVTFETYDNGEYYLQMQRHNWGNEDFLGYWNNSNNEKASIAYAQTTGLLKVGTAAAEAIFNKVSGKILQRLLVATYATSPGYWAMVNDENYEQAKKAFFAFVKEKLQNR